MLNPLFAVSITFTVATSLKTRVSASTSPTGNFFSEKKSAEKSCLSAYGFIISTKAAFLVRTSERPGLVNATIAHLSLPPSLFGTILVLLLFSTHVLANKHEIEHMMSKTCNKVSLIFLDLSVPRNSKQIA